MQPLLNPSKKLLPKREDHSHNHEPQKLIGIVEDPKFPDFYLLYNKMQSERSFYLKFFLRISTVISFNYLRVTAYR